MADFEMIPLPSGLSRMKKSELVREVEQLINISNRIIELQFNQKLRSLAQDVRVAERDVHEAEREKYIRHLERSNKKLKEKIEKQISNHQAELEQAEAFVFVENTDLI